MQCRPAGKHVSAVRFPAVDAEGHQVKADLHEDGFILLDVLARVVKAAETIGFDSVNEIVVENKAYTIPGTDS